MSEQSFSYVDTPVAERDVDVRAQFIVRTYAHLFGALMLFAAIEIGLFATGLAGTLAAAMLSTNWLFILGGFVVVSWIASKVANSAQSVGAQYAALIGFVVAEAIIFVPMLFVAEAYFDGVIASATIVTVVGFSALTAIAFVTRKDFSFMRSALIWAGFIAVAAIVFSVIFGFEMGTWFSVAMIALAGASILYDTSNVIHHYPANRYVGAALSLFASFALMLWYVLRLFMSRD